MEDVLEVYHRPLDAARPLICLDEASKQLLAEVRAPLPMEPGQVARQDGEYKREGTAALFMVGEPLAGRRHVFVRARRTRLDFAQVVKTLCDDIHPQAHKIVLVLDQLNTHGEASLYAAFPPPEARRLAERLEIHHTPKHGSWLNMAEIELSVLARQCLDAAHGRPNPSGARSRRLAARAQPRRLQGGLALHHSGRPRQTQAPLPHRPTWVVH